MGDAEGRALARAIEVGSARVLAVDTGLDAAQAARAGAARLLAARGTILRPGGGAEPWTIQGSAEEAGRMLAYGPAFDGVPLDRLLAAAPDAAFAALRLLSGAAESLPERIVPAAILAAADGSLLILPEQIALRALDGREFEERAAAYRAWNHPDLRGEEAAAFSIASLVYRVLCGRAPFAAGTEDALAADMRDGRALPARFARPGLDPALAAVLDRALGIGAGRSERPRPGAGEILAALGPDGSRAAADFVESLDAAASLKIEAEREKWLSRSEKRVGRSRFIRRRGTAIAIAAGAAVALAGIAWSIAGGRADRFTTAGLSARETVEAYYDALGALDTEKMQACVSAPTAKDDIDAATNLYVVFRVRAAYEKDGGYIGAERWLAEGEPQTAAPVYGLAGLSIAAADSERGFLARYRLIAPGGIDQTREDRLELARIKGAWRIVKLERKSTG